jgi:hypothetical protein
MSKWVFIFATDSIGRRAKMASSQLVLPGIIPAQHGSWQSSFPMNDIKFKKSSSPLRVGKGVRGGSGVGVAVGVKVGAKVGVTDGVAKIDVTVGNRVTVG